ncbi:MAG: transposase [Acidobacteriia bacterium]|nr:transposase [Terriglobia bacterium]
MGELIAEHLSDSRRGKNSQLPLADLYPQSVYSRVAGCEDVNDAERLSQDPAFRLEEGRVQRYFTKSREEAAGVDGSCWRSETCRL